MVKASQTLWNKKIVKFDKGINFFVFSNLQTTRQTSDNQLVGLPKIRKCDFFQTIKHRTLNIVSYGAHAISDLDFASNLPTL